MKRALGCVLILGLITLFPLPGYATHFEADSIIIPMDTTYQDQGMLKAFGLLFQLLKVNIPVHWVIKAGKLEGQADFTATSQDMITSDPVSGHGYRGGPFVIAADQAALASPVITAWQTLHPETAVHLATAPFDGRTGRLLTAAPTIAIIADGHEDIAFSYLNAAGVPDSSDQPWPGGKLGDYSSYPDILTIEEVAGPTDTDHADGALFRLSGQPSFCQIMTMHWDVKKVVDEVVAEYRSFLQFPTHMMAECQAVNAIENNVFGRFLTPNGFLIDNAIADSGPFELLNLDTPFGQIDGEYSLVKGSERAYTLPTGDTFLNNMNVVMVKDATTTLGIRSVWMTGYIDGKCTISEDAAGVICTAGVGKISYLGGHEYETKLPISGNPKTQGTRLFLNSLFEASCTTWEGQPLLQLTKSGPATTTDAEVTYTLYYVNSGMGPALNLTLTDTLAPGTGFVSCTGGCQESNGMVTWLIGDLGGSELGSVQLTVTLPQHGVHENQFSAEFKVGINTKHQESNITSTDFQDSFPDAGVPDTGVPDAGAPDSAATDGSQVLVDSGLPSDGISWPDGWLFDQGPRDSNPAAEGSTLTEGGVSDHGGAVDSNNTGDNGGILESGATEAGGSPEAGASTDISIIQTDGRSAADSTSGSETPGGQEGDSGGCDCAVNGKPDAWGVPLLLLLWGLGRRRRNKRLSRG